MAKPVHVDHVDPDLVAGWVAARSIARGLPAPVLDHGGLRVDTGLPGETRRYVFAGPAHGIRALAESIDEPHIPIKMCGTGDQLLALVPRRWELQPAAYFMTRDGAGEAAPIPASGYRLEFSIENQATAARIVAEDGSVAASGYAAEHGGVFIYDRVSTDAAHRRRGLGKALMAALGATRRDAASRQVLVATEEGRALYVTLGWRVLAPYSTVLINAAASART